jgi:hypothetical protein
VTHTGDEEWTDPPPCRMCKRRITKHKQAIYLWMTPDGPLYVCSQRCKDAFDKEGDLTPQEIAAEERARQQARIAQEEEDMAAKKKAATKRAVEAATKAVKAARVQGKATAASAPVPKVTEPTTVMGTIPVKQPKAKGVKQSAPAPAPVANQMPLVMHAVYDEIPSSLPDDAPPSLKVLPYYAEAGIDDPDTFAAKAARVLAIRASMDALKAEESSLRDEIMISLMTADKPAVVVGYHTFRVIEGKTQSRLNKPKLISLGVTAEIIAAASVEVEIDPYVEVRDARKKTGDKEE